MTEEKLKPCPFCGGEVYIDYFHDFTGISCDICKTSFRLTPTAWNTRVGLVRGEVDSEILKMLKEIIVLCNCCGNFANGVEHNGIDEGIYRSGEIIDRAEELVDSIDSGEVFKK
jgi:hypothetical protein